MKLLVVVLLISPALAGLTDLLSTGLTGRFTTGISNGLNTMFGSKCNRDFTQDFRTALYDFSTKLYKQVAARTQNHFALSQYSMWLTLAALAEGSSGPAQDELFNALNLPKEDCLRKKYYDIATKLEVPGDDVTLARKRFLVLDEGVKLNETWGRWVREAGLLDTFSLPLKANPAAAADALRELVEPPPAAALATGNSLLVDSLDYNGMWSTAFPDADVIPNVPFYDDQNNQIGTVDMMSVKRRVKLAYLPILNAKAVEIPVGRDERYKMLVLVNLGKASIVDTIALFRNTLIIDVFDSLMESLVPLMVSFPRFTLRTQTSDMRSALEAMGVRSIWSDPVATAHVSEPAALPAQFLQRVSLNIAAGGVAPPRAFSSSILSGLTAAATGLEAAVGREFNANRPFMFGLVDSATNTCLFTGAFTRP